MVSFTKRQLMLKEHLAHLYFSRPRRGSVFMLLLALGDAVDPLIPIALP